MKSSNKKRTIPVIVRVSDVNDNAPVFMNTPYETTVSEVSCVQSVALKFLCKVYVSEHIKLSILIQKYILFYLLFAETAFSFSGSR